MSKDIIRKFDDSERIKNVCKFYGEKLRMKEKNLRLQFMIDSVHRVAYCRHGKVCWNNSLSLVWHPCSIKYNYTLGGAIWTMKDTSILPGWHHFSKKRGNWSNVGVILHIMLAIGTSNLQHCSRPQVKNCGSSMVDWIISKASLLLCHTRMSHWHLLVYMPAQFCHTYLVSFIICRLIFALF